MILFCKIQKEKKHTISMENWSKYSFIRTFNRACKFLIDILENFSKSKFCLKRRIITNVFRIQNHIVFSFVAYPGFDKYEIRDVTWNFTFYNCTISTNNVFVFGFRYIILNNNLIKSIKLFN